MPELPDIAVYLSCLDERITGSVLRRIRVVSPFLIRSVDPPIDVAQGMGVVGLRRLGKRVVWCLERDHYLVFHLMIAGRFRWAKPGAKLPGKIGLAAFDFDAGSVLLTEAGNKKRASLHLVKGKSALADHDPGGLEVLDASLSDFSQALTRENRTLKRALTDPRLLAGIGNAYSDEILHAARLSPVKLTGRLTEEEIACLFEAVVCTLNEWTDRLLRQFARKFPGPGDITAFRDDFAVHGRFGQPCPVCGNKVQRIRYADNETNYCAKCQTGGRILADRSLSRLLKNDWPRSISDVD